LVEAIRWRPGHALLTLAAGLLWLPFEHTPKPWN
jgi:hypothetical protein